MPSFYLLPSARVPAEGLGREVASFQAFRPFDTFARKRILPLTTFSFDSPSTDESYGTNGVKYTHLVLFFDSKWYIIAGWLPLPGPTQKLAVNPLPVPGEKGSITQCARLKQE